MSTEAAEVDVDTGSPFEGLGEEEESTTFTLPLLDDDLSAGQLGSHAYRNWNESHASAPRELVTAKDIPHVFYFHARCRRPVYGVFPPDAVAGSQTTATADPPVPAALLVLDFAFQQRTERKRFKKAEIELSFHDAETVLLNPHDASTKIDLAHQPAVRHFEPQDFQGPVKTAPGKTSLGAGLSVGDPMNIATLSVNGSREDPFEVEGSFRVTGVLEGDPASKVHWVLREDKLKKTGIRHTFSVAAVVSYVPGRKFAAKLRIRADVALPIIRPVAGDRDDPIYFDSGKDTPYDAVIPRDLKSFTRLDAGGGTWLA